MSEKTNSTAKRHMIDNELQNENHFSEFESHPAHFANGLTIRPFRFLENYSDQNSDQLAKLKKYKEVKLYSGKRMWVQYWYRIPKDLQHLYGGKAWKKFRVFEDINREKDAGYAQSLLVAVKYALENGYDPFERELTQAALIKAKVVPKKNWTIMQALNYFIQQWEDRGNDPETTDSYEDAVGVLLSWLRARKLQNYPAAELSTEWVEASLKERMKQKNWSNRTFNNNLNLLTTCFNYLVKKKVLNINPASDIDRKKQKSEKHKYYDPAKFALLQKLLPADPTVQFAARMVYYLCIRSNQELRNFQIGNIFPDRRQVYITADTAKTDKGRYVAIPDEIFDQLAALRKQHPDNYYVFGAWPNTGPKKVLELRPGPKAFGKNFLGDRFSSIREKAGLSDDYTLYGLKHTRIIHLKQDGAKDSDIIGLTGHTSYEAYSGYLRDLGVDGNPEAINKITRKF